MRISSITSKQAVLAFLLIFLIIGAIVALIQLQNQQELRGRASSANWATSQSAAPACSSFGAVVLNINFTNQEPNLNMNVSVTDQQSNQTTYLGTIDAGKTATGIINTKLTSLDTGKVTFTLAWTDNENEKDIKEASYTAVDSCPPPSVCTNSQESTCTWDELEDATEYNITIIDTTNGQIVASSSVPAPTTKLVFPSQVGKTYQCTVNAVNACGAGSETKSQPLTCTLPSPTPTLPICKDNESICTWDSLREATEYNVEIIDVNTGEVIKSDNVPAPTTSFTFPQQPGVTYQCNVTSVNKCGTGESIGSPPVSCTLPTPTPTTTPAPSSSPTPTPTPSPTPTPTPTPTNTPTPSPSPTPSSTPQPTLTPYPTYTPIPTPTPYPTATKAPTPTPIIIVKTQPTTPPQIIYQQGPTQPVPTLVPTGSFETAAIIGGISVFLAALGGIIFFIL